MTKDVYKASEELEKNGVGFKVCVCVCNLLNTHNHVHDLTGWLRVPWLSRRSQTRVA